MVGSLIVNGIAPLSNLINPKAFKKRISGEIFMPFYHAIAEGDMPHVSHLYPVKSATLFENDIDFLLRHYAPLDLQALIHHDIENTTPTKPSFFLSFDDGLREFYSVIAPILKRKGVPATCFLNSDFVDNKGLFFRYQISLIIDCLKKNPLRKSPTLSRLIGTENSNREKAAEKLLALGYSDCKKIATMADELEIDFKAFLKSKKPYLSSSEVNSLIQEGFTFGAHSIDHPEYRLISEEEQKRQTKVSMDSISKLFNLDYKVFSFPFTDHGVSKHHIEWMHDSCGVQLSFGCAGHKKDVVDKHFQRVAFENGKLSAREIHNAEIAYSIIRKAVGKNTVQRT